MFCLTLIPGAWAMWNGEEEKEHTLFLNTKYSEDLRNGEENGKPVETFYPWKTICDFLNSGEVWTIPSLFHQYSKDYFPSSVHKVRKTIFQVQSDSKNNENFKKLLKCLRVSYMINNSPHTINGSLCIINNFIFQKSIYAQFRDHQLGEKIYALSDINSALHLPFLSFNEKDMTIFDVDDTLTVFLNPFYNEHVLKDTPLHQKFLSMKENVRGRFLHWLLTTAPFVLVEPQITQLISDLQARELKVMALTAFRPLTFLEEPQLKSLPTWRVELLKKLGLDFAKNFPMSPMSWRFDVRKNQDFPEPYFEKGVLFSGLAGKPNALFNFLRAVSFKPERVLFIDDDLSNVVSVYRELTRLGIKCYSILYTRVNPHSVNGMFSEVEFDTYLKMQEQFIEELYNSSGKWSSPKQSNINLIRVWKKRK